MPRVTAAIYTIAGAPHVAGPRQVLKVGLPRQAAPVEEVNDGGHVDGDANGLVMVEAKVVAGNGGEIVGLTWVRLGVVACEEDALRSELCNVRVVDDMLVVLATTG